MNILSLFNSFVKHFNNILDQNILFHTLESNISYSTNELNLNILKDILEFIDLDYKNSKERKDKYYVHATRQRTLITSLGLISFNKTYYKSKKKINGKFLFFSYLEDYLGLDKWVKMTLSAEVNLVNNALDNGMSWAAKYTIPNYITTRQTISSKVKNLNYNLEENTPTKTITPKILYIEADEVHSNLQANKKKMEQKKKNKIVPVILTHEGHKEDFVNKKQLKNTHYIASSILKTDKLWDQAYRYLDNRYDLDKVEYLFISGDGGTWIKGYDEAFPYAIYVFDKFHYRKYLNYLFKKHPLLIDIADCYLRNRMVNEFKQLVNLQIKNYPNQRKYLIQKQNILINNIEGIINQKHPMYKCPCSMEGHISNKYAKFITSRSHSYSEDGLENIVQLLTMKANNITLTEEIYHQFKYAHSTYKQLNLQKFISSFRLQANQACAELNNTYSLNYSNFSLEDKYKLDFYFNKRS